MAESITLDSLPVAQRRQVEALVKPVRDIAAKFGVVRERMREIAPRVMKVFNLLKVEHAELSFVDFARMIDPTVPPHAKDRGSVVGYQGHKTYYTLDNMRRLLVQRPRGRQGVRDSAADGLARTIATILQVVSDGEAVWKAIQTEFAFNERVMGRLRKRVADTKPLVALHVVRPVNVGKVIHMEPKATEAAGELTQRGRRVNVAA